MILSRKDPLFQFIEMGILFGSELTFSIDRSLIPKCCFGLDESQTAITRRRDVLTYLALSPLVTS